MTYVVLGGAHADILTDGVQGFLMVVVGAVLVVLFVVGYGVDGGFRGMIANLEAQDPNLVTWLNPDVVLYHSWWSIRRDHARAHSARPAATHRQTSCGR